MPRAAIQPAWRERRSLFHTKQNSWCFPTCCCSRASVGCLTGPTCSDTQSFIRPPKAILLLLHFWVASAKGGIWWEFWLHKTPQSPTFSICFAVIFLDCSCNQSIPQTQGTNGQRCCNFQIHSTKPNNKLGLWISFLVFASQKMFSWASIKTDFSGHWNIPLWICTLRYLSLLLKHLPYTASLSERLFLEVAAFVVTFQLSGKFFFFLIFYKKGMSDQALRAHEMHLES